MDVTSLYTNIPQEEGIQVLCRALISFYQNKILIPTPLLGRALRLILQEKSFQFNGKKFLQIHGTVKVETHVLSESVIKPLVWKRFIEDVFFFTLER